MEQTSLQERNPGLDLLRSLSMLMVVVLHLLGRGGVMAAVVPFTAHYWAVWLLETAAYCAVDCYALLSGYLLVRSRCRPSGLIGLWMQVFCYSAGITALFAVFYEPVSLTRFLKSCLPVLFTQYWYFTAYFAVYCLAPFFNKLIAALSQEGLRRLLWTGFVLLSLLPTLTGADAFVTGEGYSFLWLAALYFGGAYLRLYPPQKRPSRVYLALYGLCVAALLAFRLGADLLTGTAVYSGWLLAYPSPLVVGAAVCLFQCCRELSLSSPLRHIIARCAPASFGVYLLHAQPFVFHRLLSGAALPLLALPAWQFIPAVLGAALAIFALGIAADSVRIAVFRLLRISVLADRLGGALERRLPPL